jgi:predicted amidophosphoribosyltransferase
VAARLVQEHWGQDVDPEALARASGAIDLDAASACCPACGEAFPTSAKRCPACGLRFG